MKAEELLREKRQAVMTLTAKHGARNPRIFGKDLRVYLAQILDRIDRILEYTGAGSDRGHLTPVG